MYNVVFSDLALSSINMYSQKYREYFQELYTDTGLWSEDQILDGYIRESERRREDIILLLERRLSEDIVL